MGDIFLTFIKDHPDVKVSLSRVPSAFKLRLFDSEYTCTIDYVEHIFNDQVFILAKDKEEYLNTVLNNMYEELVKWRKEVEEDGNS